MRLPEIAERLRAKAEQYGDHELTVLANEMKRRSGGRRAATMSVPATIALMNAIRAYHMAHPGMPQAGIARVFNVNPGRVSEALKGKRT